MNSQHALAINPPYGSITVDEEGYWFLRLEDGRNRIMEDCIEAVTTVIAASICGVTLVEMLDDELPNSPSYLLAEVAASICDATLVDMLDDKLTNSPSYLLEVVQYDGAVSTGPQWLKL